MVMMMMMMKTAALDMKSPNPSMSDERCGHARGIKNLTHFPGESHYVQKDRYPMLLCLLS